MQLIETASLSQDVIAVVGTADGVAALTHLWWNSGDPAENPFATDPTALRARRRRGLAVGHPFVDVINSTRAHATVRR